MNETEYKTRGTSSEKTVKDIRRATRKQYSAEEKIRIVLDGLRGEETIAELCRQEGIAQSLYYSWSKEFLEATVERVEQHYFLASEIDALNETPQRRRGSVPPQMGEPRKIQS